MELVYRRQAGIGIESFHQNQTGVADLSNQDLDLTLLNAGGVGLDRPVGARGTMAGPDIEPPSMQGANDFAAVEIASAEWPAPMRALVIDAIELALEIPEGKLAPLDVHGAAFARREVNDLGDGNKLAHVGRRPLVEFIRWAVRPRRALD
jgi:hypothetical protein